MTNGGPGGPGSGPTGSGGPFALVGDVDCPELAVEERHHLERVLRLRHGSPLTVGDGAGRWRECRYGSRLELVGPIQEVRRPEPTLTVGFALVKGSRPDLIVQKLTELGIDRIAPFVAQRSIVRWDETRMSQNLERWRRVAREAVMQCRRPWLPEVTAVVGLPAVVAAGGAVLADPAGEALSAADQTVLIGPEGGWTPEERALVSRRVSVADHVLRSETAAIAVGTLMIAHRRGS